MVAAYTRPNFTDPAQTGPVYRTNLDAAAQSFERLGIAFLPQAQAIPDMTLRVLAGALLIGGTLTEIAAQDTGTIAAPATHPRIDRVVLNPNTGAIQVVTGAEAASPLAPAIPADRLPICRFQLATSTTAITNSMIVDERAAPSGTAALRNVGTGADQVPTNADIQVAIATITAGENLADRDQIYQDVFNQRGNGATRWYKIDADATGPVRISPRIGIALAAITAGNTGLAQVRAGRVGGFAGLTAGLPVFASATAGAVTQTAPAIPATGTQVALRLVGIAASATEIDFDPDDDTLFVRAADALAAGSSVTVEHWPDTGAPDRVPFAHVLGQAFATSASRATGVNGTGYGGYGFRIRLAASAVSTSGSKVRLTLRANSGGFTFNDVFIGEAAASGNAWDFAATPARVTFGGANGATISANSDLVSDTIAFAIDETKNYIVAINAGAPTTADYVSNASAPTGWTGYTKVGGNTEASSVAPSGYTANDVVALKAVEVEASTRREPEPLFPEARFSGATDKFTCRYDDGAGANADTRTTVINRTGGARDVVAEVLL